MAEQGWTANNEFSAPNIIATTLSVGTLTIGDVGFDDVTCTTLSATTYTLVGDILTTYVKAESNGNLTATGTVSAATVTGTTSVTGENVNANIAVSAPTGNFTDVITTGYVKTPELYATSGSMLIHNGYITDSMGAKFRHTVIDTTNSSATQILEEVTVTDSVYHVNAVITGIKDDGSKTASIEIKGTFKNDGGTLTQVGLTTYAHRVRENANYNADFAINATSILVNVTGDSGDNVNWQCVAFVYGSGILGSGSFELP